ncbi:PREDICTED: uncharacterized protein LOC105132963 [Populus euphratica]|uniref:Uncharacterized protein LOC105132963 n=1 Tax=Populus euphratica TaxID=75702 RepID=A0AAJ6XXM5_POPEU|nr:PREDICTED: uncharacterized protein LOC105132963 [Populus euphratica]
MSSMKTVGKPPLAKSPTRLRPRRSIRSESTTSQTPPGSLAKSQRPNRKWDMEESDLRPEYQSISWELRALAKMTRGEFGNGESSNGGVGRSLSANSSPLFERVTIESSKRRDSKKLENLRKSVSAAYYVERNENPRYMLRSMNKENKKPPLPVHKYEKSVLASERKVTARKARKI